MVASYILQVSSFCKQALNTCELVAHPRAPSFNAPLPAAKSSSAYLEDSLAASTVSNPTQEALISSEIGESSFTGLIDENEQSNAVSTDVSGPSVLNVTVDDSDETSPVEVDSDSDNSVMEIQESALSSEAQVQETDTDVKNSSPAPTELEGDEGVQTTNSSELQMGNGGSNVSNENALGIERKGELKPSDDVAIHSPLKRKADDEVNEAIATKKLEVHVHFSQ